jgi:hypothetical protein
MQWSATLRPSYAWKIALSMHWTGGWVSAAGGLSALAKYKGLTVTEMRPPILQPVV